jgi:HEAT repeat protein
MERRITGNTTNRTSGDKRAVEPLIGALEDEIDGIRINAALALGKLSDKKAITPLLRTLENEKIDIKPFFFGALFLLGEEEYSSEIIKSIENPDADIRHVFEFKVLGCLSLGVC